MKFAQALYSARIPASMRRISTLLRVQLLRWLLPLLRLVAPQRLPGVAIWALRGGHSGLARQAAQRTLARDTCSHPALRVLLSLAPNQGAGFRDEVLAQAVVRCPGLRATLHLDASRCAAASGDYVDALRHCRQGFASNPSVVVRLELRVQQAHLTGTDAEVVRVLRDIERALQAGATALPNESLLQATTLAEDCGDVTSARALLERLVAKDPSNLQALNRLLLLNARHLPIEQLRMELADWLARGERYAQAARPMAVYAAYYQDQDDAHVLMLTEEAAPSTRPMQVHAALVYARRGQRRRAMASLASVAFDNSSELAAARAEVCRRTGDSAGQIAALNGWNAHHDVAPIRALAAEGDLRLPVSCDSSIRPAVGDSPLVSVIMPVYNPGRLLDMAVASVLGQSYRHLELLLVDDASPRATAKLLNHWQGADPRLRLLRMPRNGGPYLAKNAALARCSGELITFADGDDWNHPQRIARQVALLEQQSKAEAVCVRYLRVDAAGHIVLRRTAVKTAWQSLMLRRRTHEALGFFMPLRAGADTEFVDRIKATFGAAAVIVDPAITLLAQHQATTLTGGGALAMTWRPVGGVRHAHHLAFRRWHRRQLALDASLHVPHPLPALPYPVPPALRR